MYGNNPIQNEVCNALVTLTHRQWCDGGLNDSAVKRRKWLRWWTADGANVPIFGPDNRPGETGAFPDVAHEPSAVEIMIDMLIGPDAPIPRDVDSPEPTAVTGVLPERLHPSQVVFIAMTTRAEIDEHIDLTDGRGILWRLERGGVPGVPGVFLILPDDTAEGDASVRIGVIRGELMSGSVAPYAPNGMYWVSAFVTIGCGSPPMCL
jgi:hypothetical protein